MLSKTAVAIILLCLFCKAGKSQQATNQVIINDLDPALFLSNFLNYDKNTAVYCAQLSEVAYWDSARIQQLVKQLNQTYTSNKYKFQTIVEHKSGTQVLLWGNADFIIVAFRGTEFFDEFKDIIVDAKFFRYAQESGFSNLPAGHGGFRRCIINLINDQDIFNKIRAFETLCNTNKVVNFPVYTTGHSLGAALATIIIEPLNYEKFNFSGTYAFAPPLTVSITDTPALNKYRPIVYDIVNYLDYVTRAGCKSRKYLAHFGKYYRICQSGLINEEDEKRNGKYVSHPWGTKFKLYEYHKLGGYLAGLKNAGNTNNEIISRRLNNATCF